MCQYCPWGDLNTQHTGELPSCLPTWPYYLTKIRWGVVFNMVPLGIRVRSGISLVTGTMQSSTTCHLWADWAHKPGEVIHLGEGTPTSNLHCHTAIPIHRKGLGNKPWGKSRASPYGSFMLLSTLLWQLLWQHCYQAELALGLPLENISGVEREDLVHGQQLVFCITLPRLTPWRGYSNFALWHRHNIGSSSLQLQVSLVNWCRVRH